MRYDVAVTICVKNCADFLGQCLCSVRAAQPREIIVVDGNSHDGSYEVACEYADIVLQDNGCGLAAARRMAVEAASAKYILVLGPDFLLPTNFLADILVQVQEKSEFSGFSAQVGILQPQNIWDRVLDAWWRFQRPLGNKDVIGTPCIFLRELITKYNFADDNIAADDTELCLRMAKDNHKFAIVPVFAEDIAGKTWTDINTKFTSYGRADGQFYLLNRQAWTRWRRLQSWSYALRQGIRGMRWALGRGDLLAAGFMLIYAYLRWTAMFNYWLHNRK